MIIQALQKSVKSGTPEGINVGDSAVVNLQEQFIAGPLHKEPGILYAEIDPQQMRRARWNLDVARRMLVPPCSISPSAKICNRCWLWKAGRPQRRKAKTEALTMTNGAKGARS